LRNRLILEVANEIVSDRPLKAIELWQSCEDPKATERWIRESYKSQDRDQLKQTLKKMRKRTQDGANKIFVEDFYARKYKGKRTSIYTDILREANKVVELDDCYHKDVESGVIDHYRRQNIDAFFTENQHWRALFAFTFWELLFADNQLQHNEFDHFPAVLNKASFYNENKQAVHDSIAFLDNPVQVISRFTKLATEYYGYPTGLFRWRNNLLDSILACIRHAPQGAIGKALLNMAKDFRQRKDGYPDLMVIDNQTLRFEEVKAPGDTLRPNQLLRINSLRKAGFDVDLTQIKWATNPEQIYAVVDIETTGGRKNGNSITEIAVVKVQNSQVISEWSSLVNPRTRIPPYITHLTGITNQMVAQAPLFEQIADELAGQLSDAIFVAHNVSFDYGFIKSAYNNMGRTFRKAKFCTVINSRKTFPGLPSYSLGNLTQHFDIDLDNHHRALSDARATADLLLLIQDARISGC
jgi:DNA polymerase-3 subunit epsilon